MADGRGSDGFGHLVRLWCLWARAYDSGSVKKAAGALRLSLDELSAAPAPAPCPASPVSVLQGPGIVAEPKLARIAFICHFA